MDSSTPNLLYISIDDLFDFMAFRDSFGVTIQTPNLDALFEDSTVFSNAFATTPVCNPSRTATLTGKSPFETGVLDNRIPWHETTPLYESLPAQLKDGGFHTASAGKIFHGYKPQPDFVNDRVFSEDVPDIRETYDRSLANPNGGGWGSEGYEGQDNEFYDGKVANWAVNFLETYDGADPFALMVGFKHPHNTFEAPQEFYDLYNLEDIKVPDSWVNGDLADAPAFAEQFINKALFLPDEDFDLWAATVEGYLAAISHMDAKVGEVMAALDASGHADDTVIIAFSDHGYHLGDKDHFAKFTLWEESAKVPLAIKVPGHDGQVVDTPVSLIDIMPTLLDATGLDPAPHAIGESLMPLVDSSYGTHAGGPVFTQVYGSMSIREGDLRFIRYADGSEELYDVSVDPAQTVNLANDPAQGALLETLRDSLWDEAARYGVITNDDDPILNGTTGDDVLMAQPSTDALIGGQGDDAYFLFSGDVDVVETASGGHDTAYFVDGGPHRLPDHVEDGVLGLSTSRDKIEINGNGLDNTFYLNAKVKLNTGAGDDVVYTEWWSSNSVWGAEGDDEMYGARWTDHFTGGAGDDYLFGSHGNDHLTGSAGADTLDGGEGIDVAKYGSSQSGVHVSLTTGRAYGHEAWGDRLSNIENLSGGVGNDTFMGDGAENRLIGFGGRDYLNGQSGDDFLMGGQGADTLVGGLGEDYASWFGAESGVHAHLGRGQGFSGEAAGDRLFSIENLEGTNSADTFMGSDGANVLSGRNGQDYLNGQGGDDTLIGGGGADGLVGGGGQDVASYAGSNAGVSVDLSRNLTEGGHAEGDWFWSVEGLEGSDHDDWLALGASNGTAAGGAGDDVLVFGAGNGVATGGTGADLFGIRNTGTEGAAHRVTDFAEGDGLALEDGVSVAQVVTQNGGTMVSLSGEDFMASLFLEGVTLSEAQVQAAVADDPLEDPFDG